MDPQPAAFRWAIGVAVALISIYVLDGYNMDLGNMYIAVLALGFILTHSGEFEAFTGRIRDLAEGM